MKASRGGRCRSGDEPRAALERVTKSFGGRVVLRDATMSVSSGEVLGLVGPNGSGKTTVLRVLAGLLRPDRGAVLVCGRRPAGRLSCRHTVFFAGGATLPGALRVGRWARMFGVADELRTDRRVIRTLSRGQRQLVGLRVALARLPLHLLMLDEPWDGLDREGASWLMHALGEARTAGTAVVVSSHRSADLGSVATRLIVLRSGRVVDVGSDAVAAERLVPAGSRPATYVVASGS